jgi:L-malate glycosyltransferase
MKVAFWRPRTQRLPRRDGPVRACFLIDRLSRAGTETQLLALIRSLDRARVQPHLVLLDGTDDDSRALEPGDCPTIRLGLRSLLRPAAVAAMLHLRQFWRRQRIDVLQTYFLDSTYVGVPLARICGMKKVVRVRNNLGYWLTGRHRRLGRWMGRLADFTLTNSAGGKQSIVEVEGLSPDKIEVLENGVDLERFAEMSPPDTGRGVVRIGMVANLRPVKNVDGLVRAAAALVSTGRTLHFEVAGDGEERPRLEGLIAERGLRGSFHLLGPIADVPAFLARQDIAVLCSHSEGMSNALLEYMAAGRAIVATDVGANGRLIQDQVHGLLVPARDDDALATAIARLLEHPQRAELLGVKARERVGAEHSRTAMVRRFEDFYERLVDM